MGIIRVIIIILVLSPIAYWFIKRSEEKDSARETYMQRYYSVQMAEVDQMTGIQFEEFCCAMLQKTGYTNISLTKGSNDQGVDITAEKDDQKYAVQCKRYSSVLGNTPVQEVFAGSKLYGCDIPVVMTNSFFTKGAKELAAATGVQLWNRDYIMDMLFADTPDPTMSDETDDLNFEESASINRNEPDYISQSRGISLRTAYWVRHKHLFSADEYECTACGSRFEERTDYCMQCGSQMGGSWKDDDQIDKPSLLDVIIGDK